MDVELDLRKNASLNAQERYEKAKKAVEKIKGAQEALKETEKKLEERSRIVETKGEKGIRKRDLKEKKWYEKFRWFESSEGFLVVGGRDAVTNEILIKKHVEKNDLVFHADVHGAPFFVVKNPGNKEIPEDTLRETAEAAASYSSSWKRGLGSCDVYQVSPEQVSKKAESGEYLPRGGFMIRGSKNWFKGMELKIAVGLTIGEDATVIGGPESAVATKTRYFIEIGVGDLKPKELALEIKKRILQKTNKEDGLKVKKVSIDEIQKFIPSGQGAVL
ncbi:MAG: NFACT RNA binding domain-containing protein [Candidatus Altiarchaeota archaeon]